MLPSPDQNLKIGSVGRDFFFFFFLRTVRELSFPIFFFKFLNGENSGGMQSKRISYKSCKCFFKPLNKNFSKFFAQIWHFKKKKKNTRPCFFAFYGRSGEGNITIFFFGLMKDWGMHVLWSTAKHVALYTTGQRPESWWKDVECQLPN